MHDTILGFISFNFKEEKKHHLKLVCMARCPAGRSKLMVQRSVFVHKD